MKKRLASIVVAVVALFALALPAMASSASDLTAANDHLVEAKTAAATGNVQEAKAGYDRFVEQWLASEDGIRGSSRNAYKSIEDDMGNVSFAFLQKPVNPAKVGAHLTP